jgi:hypothetical protein
MYCSQISLRGPFGTVIIFLFFVSVNVSTGALSLTQTGRVVVMNTHFYLAPKCRHKLGYVFPFLSVPVTAIYGVTLP